MLRSSAIKIISALKIEGGCNVQFALNPDSFEYAVIEVNPRVSRSSALASKATGYPIAKVATKIAIGYALDEIKNSVTDKTSACFEPVLDYVVVKIPKWPFNKFLTASKELGTQMKATGEVMAIGASMESALLKAIRSLEENVDSLQLPKLSSLSNQEIVKKLENRDSERIWTIAEALRRNVTINKISEITTIDRFFLSNINRIVNMERKLNKGPFDIELLREAKEIGFTDAVISRICNIPEKEIKKKRLENDIVANYKMVDTCAAEFDAQTPYYYSSYDSDNEADIKETKKKIIVLGSGPIRIGQGIEFDYCSVHSVWALKRLRI